MTVESTDPLGKCNFYCVASLLTARFLQDDLKVLRSELQQKAQDCGKQASVLEQAVSKLEKELNVSQTSLKELIKKVTE